MEGTWIQSEMAIKNINGGNLNTIRNSYNYTLVSNMPHDPKRHQLLR